MSDVISLAEARARLSGRQPFVSHPRCPFCSVVRWPDEGGRACGQCLAERRSTHDPISLRRLRRPKEAAPRRPQSAARRRGVRYRVRMI